MANVDASSGRARRSYGFVVASLAVIFMMAGASAPSPFYPALQERLSLGTVGVTVAFALYAVALLVSLLIGGSLSDHVGRRPVVSIAFVVLAGSVIVIWLATSAGALMAGRALQGLASGILLPALSAMVTDLVHRAKPQRAATVNAVTPMLGLAAGTIVAGIALELAPTDAIALVFVPLAIIYLALAAAAWVAPETSPRREGWGSALRPRIAVPQAARSIFMLSIPIMVAGWATGGLFLSLGASIVRNVLGVENHALQGLAIGLLPAAGAITVLVLQRTSARIVTIYGAIALATGTLLSLVGIAVDSFALYLAALTVAGTGFGAVFAGVVRSLAPTVPAAERAELFASLYTVSYLAFGIPAVLAGLTVPILTLSVTTAIFGAIVAVLASVAAILRLRAPH